MKFTIIAALTLIASAMAQNTTAVPSNGMGGTKASASITVDNPYGKNAGGQVNGNMMIAALTSTAVAAYAFI